MANSGPIRSHRTETSEKAWSGPKAETSLGDAGKAELRKAHAWVDGNSDPSTKAAYKFIHHEVSAKGKPGPANVSAATSGIAVLNGGRGGANIPEEDRKGVYNHLARHLKDAGREPPPLE
ncbi:MAG TPA: hypothetical protein VEU28_04855 [Actinomycetota bacterium]|nr:hypothetical protein [Actinomycetota bacterium]